MDTSDSEEFFESADEDISSDSDEEPSIKAAENNDNDFELLKKSQNVVDNVEPLQTSQKDELNRNISTETSNIKSQLNTEEDKDKSSLNKNRPEFGVPPARVGCPFTKNPEIFKFEPHPCVSSANTSNKVEIEPCKTAEINEAIQDRSDRQENEKTAKKRPEYGIPPARVLCSFTKNSADFKFEPHPCVALAQEYEEAKAVKSDKLDSDNISDSDKQTEPGNSSKSQSPLKEAKSQSTTDSSDNMKVDEEKDEHPWDDSGTWGFDDPIKTNINIENNIVDTKSSKVAETDTKSVKNVLSQDSSIVEKNENLWNDSDNWGFDDDPIRTSITTEEIKIDNDAKSIKNNVNESKKDESLWNDSDNWGFESEPVTTNINTKSDAGSVKNSTEDDLWQSNEGWGFENEDPTATLSKPLQQDKDISKTLDNLTLKSNSETSWGGWGNWGLTNVLSTAATLTTTVSQGITTALETGIGIPDPAELARQDRVEESQETSEKPEPIFGITNLVSSLSTKVISGGLDTLETIGKKTMEVLQENDPGLRKKRAFLKLDNNKPVLSHILREAKEKNEREYKEQVAFVKKPNYETVFDDYQGLVHLEALEMLSKQCGIKLETIAEKRSEGSLKELQETLEQVKELCEIMIDEDEDVLVEEIQEKISAAVLEINIPLNYSKLFSSWHETEKWLNNNCIDADLHYKSIETLAQLTAIAVEQYHKAAELLLVKDHRSTVNEADSLVQITTSVLALITVAATKFSDAMNDPSRQSIDNKEVNTVVTNIFFEAANSKNYIEDAFQLLIPVLQVGAM